MARTASFKVKKDPARVKPWFVNIPAAYSPTGRRSREFFKTKDAAEGRAQQLRVSRDVHGTAALSIKPDLAAA